MQEIAEVNGGCGSMSAATKNYDMNKVPYRLMEAHANVSEFLGMDFEIVIDSLHNVVTAIYSR